MLCRLKMDRLLELQDYFSVYLTCGCGFNRERNIFNFICNFRGGKSYMQWMAVVVKVEYVFVCNILVNRHSGTPQDFTSLHTGMDVNGSIHGIRHGNWRLEPDIPQN